MWIFLLNFCTFKGKILVFLRSGTVYKFKCSGCNATYYGKTQRHFKVRMCEHLWVSALIGKRVQGDYNSAIKEYHVFCNNSSGFDDIFIPASNNSEFKVTLMESLLINRDPLLWIRADICYIWNLLMIEEHNFIIW